MPPVEALICLVLVVLSGASGFFSTRSYLRCLHRFQVGLEEVTGTGYNHLECCGPKGATLGKRVAYWTFWTVTNFGVVLRTGHLLDPTIRLEVFQDGLERYLSRIPTEQHAAVRRFFEEFSKDEGWVE